MYHRQVAARSTPRHLRSVGIKPRWKRQAKPTAKSETAKPVRSTHLPSDSQIEAIPLAQCAEFELSDKELATLRRHLYAINKAGFRKYRTMRESTYVIVWRII